MVLNLLAGGRKPERAVGAGTRPGTLSMLIWGYHHAKRRLVSDHDLDTGAAPRYFVGGLGWSGLFPGDRCREARRPQHAGAA